MCHIWKVTDPQRRELEETQLEWYEAGAQRERSLARFLDLGSRYMEVMITEKEKDTL